MSEVLTGCIHIHTTYSDGTKTVEEISKIAGEVGLDFILITDHLTLKGYKKGEEGFYGKTLTLIGYEEQDAANKNHYLIFGLEDVLDPELTAKEYVAETDRLGGLGIIAHPDEVRVHLPKYPSYPWTEWNARGFHGIELWNHMSEWMEGLKKYNQIKMALRPRKYLKKPTDRILSIWDALNENQKIAGIGSIDVHGFPYKLGPFSITIFPYKVQFKSIRSHLVMPGPLSEDFETAKKQIYDAIRECRIFISNYRWGDARDFRMWVETPRTRVEIGGEGDYEDEAVLKIILPEAADVNVVRNGKSYSKFRGDSGEIPLFSPGIYRVEATKQGKGWVYSNHIRLK
ncbi:MAG: histidinol-phosphatase [candidate division Zixibacteria bacterium]|nr:histidinol-phosphatase [candidate division Zixibacteria bacterium]